MIERQEIIVLIIDFFLICLDTKVEVEGGEGLALIFRMAGIIGLRGRRY